MRALLWWPVRSPRNGYSRTPPGPEGSNGSDDVVCRGVAEQAISSACLATLAKRLPLNVPLRINYSCCCRVLSFIII